MGEARKVVTIVFSDVMGSTRLGEELDAEALRRVLERYFKAMRTILERHGGTVEKFIGDAVVNDVDGSGIPDWVERRRRPWRTARSSMGS
jgi:class 3 adenylate cyclase